MTKSQAITPPSAARTESQEETPHKHSNCPWRSVFCSQYISGGAPWLPPAVLVGLLRPASWKNCSLNGLEAPVIWCGFNHQARDSFVSINRRVHADARLGFKRYGGWLYFISLPKGGENKRSRECKCSHTSSESRVQLTLWLLFASTHAEFLGKAIGTFAFANCVKSL